MADVRVTSTGDRRVTSTGDVRVTTEGAVTFAILDQRVRLFQPAATVGTLDQRVGIYHPAETVVDLYQVVRDVVTLEPAGPFATLDQTVELVLEWPAGPIAAIRQEVRRYMPEEVVARLRQIVRTDTAAQPTRIYLDGNDITARVLAGSRSPISIEAGENNQRVAVLTLMPEPGVIDVPAYQGREVEITREQGGTIVPLFSGVVDEPFYSLDQRRTLRLRCVDLRSERLAKEDHDYLLSLTGGHYSPIVQREDATGEQWVRELMRTVPGSLDYTSAGVLRYSPWGVGTPEHTLTAAHIHWRQNSLRFSNRDEIVNRVRATLEYRYYKRNTLTLDVDLEMRTAEQGVGGTIGVLPDLRDVIPTKEALRSAVENVAGWLPLSLTFKPLPPDGWYKYSAASTNKAAFTVNPLVRELRAMGVEATLERYISQPKRERYEIEITAPQSIAQYGEVDGSELRVAAETRVDPSIYEGRGCVIIADADDRRVDVEAAIETLQAIGRREILGAHRQTQITVRYKPKRGTSGHQELLPVEIGQTVEVDTPELSGIGQVTAYTHTEAGDDRWTDVTLAVSQVSDSSTVIEDWSLPASPATYALTPRDPGQLETPDCPAPSGEEAVSGPSRIEPDGTVIITAPAINRSLVDEIIGTRTHIYPVSIPIDPLSLEVP